MSIALMLVSIVFLLLISLPAALAVDRSKFRTCAQTSFCRRHRNTQEPATYRLIDLQVHDTTDEEPSEESKNSAGGGVWSSLKQRLLPQAAQTSSDTPLLPPTMTGTLVDRQQNELAFTLTALQDDTVRIRITEPTPRVTYDALVLQPLTASAGAKALLQGPDLQRVLHERDISLVSSPTAGVEWGNILVLFQTEPFELWVYAGKVLAADIGKNMYFEIQQQTTTKSPATEKPVEEKKHDKEVVGYWEDGLAIYADGTREEKKDPVEDEVDGNHRKLSEEESDSWEESFGGHTDSRPRGPMSVGMEISFPTEFLYGLPEHAAATTLQTTRGEGAHFKDPYRLYNLDVFEYELDEVMALYGAVPLVVSHSTETTAGVFWFNPSETFVDVSQAADSTTTTHWMSESGIVDIFVVAGPKPADVYRQYAALTGVTPLPPMFSLGYHQCRWNYKDEADVQQVHDHFEEYDYPYDVLWLDIEHTDGKRYFTWDSHLFPDPTTMQDKLAAQGRRMVTIIDPHIKRDNKYYIHKEATSKGLYVKDSSGKKDFDGWCWPGSSSYLDFTAEHVRNWWAEQFGYSKYRGSTPTLFTWNDMNEPSVFNGPEVSMQKDLLNLAGDEHREWHNLYGMLFQQATSEGLLKRNKDQDVRPFVLSRAFFAGSQRFGAIWTGDNTAEWGHLKIATPMLLSLNVGALSFVGADVGGFFGNPDAELFTRWMQAGAFQPFFRGHAHHDSKRREPWVFGDETMQRLRKAAMSRYALLPYWYTTFWLAETTGMPVMRMLWMEFPKTQALFAVDDQFMVGSSMLVKPVTEASATTVEVLFPTDDLWYNAESMVLESSTIQAAQALKKEVPADINTIPVYQRGGSIIPRKLRLRRSTMMMKKDPYTLFVALDENEHASGLLHMDDEETFGYQRGQSADAKFTATTTFLSGIVAPTSWTEGGDIERIVVAGWSKKPTRIHIEVEQRDVEFDQRGDVTIIRKPGVSAASNWTLAIEY